MIVGCPKCGAGHAVPASRLDEDGRNVDCRRCGASFVVRNDEHGSVQAILVSGSEASLPSHLTSDLEAPPLDSDDFYADPEPADRSSPSGLRLEVADEDDGGEEELLPVPRGWVKPDGGRGAGDPFDGPDASLDAALAGHSADEDHGDDAWQALSRSLQDDPSDLVSPKSPGVDDDPAALEPTLAGEPIPVIPRVTATAVAVKEPRVVAASKPGSVRPLENDGDPDRDALTPVRSRNAPDGPDPDRDSLTPVRSRNAPSSGARDGEAGRDRAGDASGHASAPAGAGDGFDDLAAAFSGLGAKGVSKPAARPASMPAAARAKSTGPKRVSGSPPPARKATNRPAPSHRPGASATKPRFVPLDPDVPPERERPPAAPARRKPRGRTALWVGLVLAGSVGTLAAVGLARNPTRPAPPEPDPNPAGLAARDPSSGGTTIPKTNAQMRPADPDPRPAPPGPDRTPDPTREPAGAGPAGPDPARSEGPRGLGRAYVARTTRLSDRAGGRPGETLSAGTPVERLGVHRGFILVLIEPGGPVGFVEADVLEEQKPVATLAAENPFEGCTGAPAPCRAHAQRQLERCLEACGPKDARSDRCAAVCRVAFENCGRACRR